MCDIEIKLKGESTYEYNLTDVLKNIFTLEEIYNLIKLNISETFSQKKYIAMTCCRRYKLMKILSSLRGQH